MAAATRELIALVWALAVTLGPLALLIALLNRRDRRQTALLTAVSAELSSEALRSDVAIEVRPGLWSGGRVIVDLGPSSQEDVWPVITRLRLALPVGVRLTVDGWLDRRQSARLTVERLGEAALRRAA